MPTTAAPTTTITDAMDAPMTRVAKEIRSNARDPRAVVEVFLGFWDCTHEEADFELEIEREVVFGDFGVPVGVIAVLSFFDLDGLEIFVVGAAREFDSVQEVLDGLSVLGLDADSCGVQRVRNHVVRVVRGLEGVAVSVHGLDSTSFLWGKQKTAPCVGAVFCHSVY
jgi:hypothetical protein